jgi:hypothetical protein
MDNVSRCQRHTHIVEGIDGDRPRGDAREKTPLRCAVGGERSQQPGGRAGRDAERRSLAVTSSGRLAPSAESVQPFVVIADSMATMGVIASRVGSGANDWPSDPTTAPPSRKPPLAS